MIRLETTAAHPEPFTTKAGRLLCAAVVALAAACGGGGEPTPAINAVTPAVVPTPAPPPPATSPAPSWLSGPVGLTQLSDFPTLGFAYRYTANSDGSRPQGPSMPDPTEVISFSYLPTDQSYEIKIPGFERGRLTLWEANTYGGWHTLSTSPSPTFGVWLQRAGAANPELPLGYTSFGSWDWADPVHTPVPSTQRSSNTGYFAYGVPTNLGDVPVSGSKKYSADVFGATSASLGVWYVSGFAELTFDFSTGGLDGRLSLDVNPGGPGHRGYGTFNFAATSYTVGATRFSGKFRMPGGGEDGFFEGQFTGPQASELMVRWLLPQSAAQSGATGSLFGVLVGKQRND